MKPFLLLLFSVVVVRAELIRGQVELSGLRGEIAINSAKGGQFRNLAAGDALREDDELTTANGASAELVFSNGVRIVVAPGTTIKLSMFRQVKASTSASGSDRNLGELADEGSVVDLSLRVGRVTVICPYLQARSLISVRTTQGRSDFVKEGVYELGFERVATGELVTKSVVLSGVLRFTPEGKGEAKALSVESGNKLLATSEVGASSPTVLEKTKLAADEVEALVKALNIESVRIPAIPQATPKAPVPASPSSVAGGSSTQEAVQAITQNVVNRLVEANPSPTGG